MLHDSRQDLYWRQCFDSGRHVVTQQQPPVVRVSLPRKMCSGVVHKSPRSLAIFSYIAPGTTLPPSTAAARNLILTAAIRETASPWPAK
jgi:hypothetical protein